MKKILFSFALLFFITNVHSQNLIRFYQNAKVGYKDAQGNVIVQPNYYAGSEFKDGVALVLQNNKRGYINNKGEESFHLNMMTPHCFLMASQR